MSAVGGRRRSWHTCEGRPTCAFASFDAGLVTLDLPPRASVPGGSTARRQAVDDIENRHGAELRRNSGIRVVDELIAGDEQAPTDIAAPLPHDLASCGQRSMAGITYRHVHDSPNCATCTCLFDDDPRLGPSSNRNCSCSPASAPLPAPRARCRSSCPSRSTSASRRGQRSKASTRSTSSAAQSRATIPRCPAPATSSRDDWPPRCRRTVPR